jgi:hypothetical protein
MVWAILILLKPGPGAGLVLSRETFSSREAPSGDERERTCASLGLAWR